MNKELIELIKKELLKDKFADVIIKAIDDNEIELKNNKAKMILEVKDGKVTNDCEASIMVKSSCDSIFNNLFYSSHNEFSVLIELMNLIIDFCNERNND